MGAGEFGENMITVDKKNLIEKEFNWSYVIAGVVFGYIMYLSMNLITAIILGLGVALSGNIGCIFKRNKKSND